MTGRVRPNRSPPRVASLRSRGLDAARKLLEEGGPEALHLRAIAGEIGCGVASLYYHFAHKDALLAALAIEGFRELQVRMEKAMESGRYPRRIDAASAAYLRFMHANLPLYALMHSERTLQGSEAVRAAEQGAFASFRRSLEGDARVPAERLDDIALTCWALGRGIAATILASGETDPAAARALAEKVLRGFNFLQRHASSRARS
ncbi:TetR/AcrR family transcriptional regulator [Phenylobacterium sp.]|uniref:TetR/AcrR family transcriptional regulator n=1 Tax=Phenylobacterium sp. TaxID=1871053 RepID=UPI002E36AA33|nr:TetR/AcrR family transcriptional regulator [Phenylobacterium sp.]HEX2558901.1 TetR/AcrR family transcriptional regulator [Phenylobacterium sp.]